MKHIRAFGVKEHVRGSAQPVCQLYVLSREIEQELVMVTVSTKH